MNNTARPRHLPSEEKIERNSFLKSVIHGLRMNETQLRIVDLAMLAAMRVAWRHTKQKTLW